MNKVGQLRAEKEEFFRVVSFFAPEDSCQPSLMWLLTQNPGERADGDPDLTARHPSVKMVDCLVRCFDPPCPTHPFLNEFTLSPEPLCEH